MTLEEIKQQLDNLPRTHFGISVPHLRKLAGKIAKGDYQILLQHNDYSSFELKLLHAFVLGYIKADIKYILKYFKAFSSQVDDWAICDSLCQNFTIARKYPQEVWQFLKPYMKSSREFFSRIAAVILLSHYLNDKYIDKVLVVLDGLNTDAYYSQMGVAWGLATVMGKYPDKCLAYLQSDDCHLTPATYAKTMQKIRESLRVAPYIKQQTHQMLKDFVSC